MPSEWEDNASIKDFEECRANLYEYFTLTGINQCEENVKVKSLRLYLSHHTQKILQYSIGITDEEEKTIDEVLEAIRKFIRSKRNVLLDRIEF